MIFSDDPEGIAGVIPIIFSFFSASSTIECPKTSWYLGGLFLFDFTARLSPELISNLPVACHLVWSFSAKSYPLPFLVKQWRIFGPGIFLRYSRVLTRWFMSWPSIGPKYLKFSASNKFELSKTNDLRLFSMIFPVFLALSPKSLSIPNTFQISFLILLNVGDVDISVRYLLSAPTFGSIDMQLSFSTIVILVSVSPAWFIPSNEIPPVIPPSPMTATCCLSFLPWYLEAIAIPRAADIDVEECPTPKVSYSLSEIFGNPDIPLYILFVWNSFFLPVSILCPYAWWPTSQTIESSGVL